MDELKFAIQKAFGVKPVFCDGVTEVSIENYQAIIDAFREADKENKRLLELTK